MKRKMMMVLVAAVLAFGSVLYAEDSKSKSAEGAPNRFYTADDYEGADLELFNMIKETEWRPKLKGFFEVTSITYAIAAKSVKMTFKSNGEVWIKGSISNSGGTGGFFIKDGVIIMSGARLVYNAEKDQLEDMVSGRIFNRIGEKPAAKADATDATVNQDE